MRQPPASLLARGIQRLQPPSAATGAGRERRWRGGGRPCHAAAMADPKKLQQCLRLRLPEMEDLLHGVLVDLARRPSGEPLLRCSIQGLGFANLPARGLVLMQSPAAHTPAEHQG
jgi:hypothetical protein